MHTIVSKIVQSLPPSLSIASSMNVDLGDAVNRSVTLEPTRAASQAEGDSALVQIRITNGIISPVGGFRPPGETAGMSISPGVGNHFIYPTPGRSGVIGTASDDLRSMIATAAISLREERVGPADPSTTDAYFPLGYSGNLTVRSSNVMTDDPARRTFADDTANVWALAFALSETMAQEMTGPIPRRSAAIAEAVQELANPGRGVMRTSSRLRSVATFAQRFAVGVHPVVLDPLVLGVLGWRGPTAVYPSPRGAYIALTSATQVQIPIEGRVTVGSKTSFADSDGESDALYYFWMGGNLAVGSVRLAIASTFWATCGGLSTLVSVQR